MSASADVKFEAAVQREVDRRRFEDAVRREVKKRLSQDPIECECVNCIELSKYTCQRCHYHSCEQHFSSTQIREVETRFCGECWIELHNKVRRCVIV